MRPDMLAISIEQKDGKAYIRSPYNADFVRRIRLMSGKWDADSRRWVVCSDAVDAVRKIMMEIYGESDESPAFETVTLIVEFLNEVSSYNSPYCLAGKPIAIATWRDSGAKPGEGVAFIEGTPKSGGSAKNWYTIIPAGCVVEIYRVPKSKAVELLSEHPTDYKVSIKSQNQVDRESLVCEKKKLLERLSEINRLLDQLDL